MFDRVDKKPPYGLDSWKLIRLRFFIRFRLSEVVDRFELDDAHRKIMIGSNDQIKTGLNILIESGHRWFRGLWSRRDRLKIRRLKARPNLNIESYWFLSYVCTTCHLSVRLARWDAWIRSNSLYIPLLKVLSVLRRSRVRFYPLPLGKI